MSSTNRGAIRHPDDFYATPEWCTRAILPYLGLTPGSCVLEPACGDGAIVRVLRDARLNLWVEGVEIDSGRAAHAGQHCSVIHTADFFDLGWRQLHDPTHIITNPPFALAQRFLDRCLSFGPHITVCFLLRLNFLGSQKRAPFWREHAADVFILPKRPSFTGKGTDSVEYAWFVFGPGRFRSWQVLEVA